MSSCSRQPRPAINASHLADRLLAVTMMAVSAARDNRAQILYLDAARPRPSLPDAVGLTIRSRRPGKMQRAKRRTEATVRARIMLSREDAIDDDVRSIRRVRSTPLECWIYNQEGKPDRQ